MSCACAADSVLSDPAKRERYDVYGVDNSDDEYDDAEPEEEGEYLSPEDVFSMFLGIPPGARVQRRHYSTPTNISRAESHLFTLLQLLPALVLLGMAVAPPPSASAAADPHDAPFRVKQDATHSVERRTAAARVPFFVRPDFEGVVVGGDAEVLRRVEEAVEVLEKARLVEKYEKELNALKMRLHDSQSTGELQQQTQRSAEAERLELQRTLRAALTRAEGVPWSTSSTFNGKGSRRRRATSSTCAASARPTRASAGSSASTRHGPTRSSKGGERAVAVVVAARSGGGPPPPSAAMQSSTPRRRPPLGPRKSGAIVTAPVCPAAASSSSSVTLCRSAEFSASSAETSSGPLATSSGDRTRARAGAARGMGVSSDAVSAAQTNACIMVSR